MAQSGSLSSTVWPAPAKLNLFLHVTGRRSDGYHDLQTLFQILDWGDELSFTVNDDGKISRVCNIDDVPEAEDICVKAANLLKTRTGVKKGVQIQLHKRIPMGAGLGGGSSDAATVLCALNQMWSCGMTTRQLADLGLELGADVPVFINGHSAWADFDRDGRLDVYLTGNDYPMPPMANIYRNSRSMVNTPPQAPQIGPATLTGTELRLGWQAAACRTKRFRRPHFNS